MGSLKQFIKWRKSNLKDKQFVLLLSIVIGFLSGLVGVTIKNMSFLISWVLTKSFFQDYNYVLYVAYPLIGLLAVAFFVKRIVKSPITPGIPNTLYAISKRKGIIKKHNLFSSIIGSALTVGFGGSVGLEGPTVATTTAFGSSLGGMFKMNYKTKTLLIGCAASGAMAALLNAPIAAIVFAIEVIMLDLTTASLIPLLLASVSAAITSHMIFGDDMLIHFKPTEAITLSDMPFYVLLGILCGILSVYFSKVYFLIAGWFEHLKQAYSKALVGGIILGILLFFLPPLYGEGYETINALIDGRADELLKESLFSTYSDNFGVLIGFFICLIFFKIVALTVTVKAGGVGGIFAPTLFMGSIVGFTFSRAFNYLGIASLSESNFILVGMGGLMAGVLHAPLTAIFLIAEITGGYELFIPLMITASIAYTTVKFGLSNSVYTFQLAKRGELITHDKDQAVLTLMKLHEEIEKDFLTVDPYASLGDLVKIISESSRNLFPVVDKNHYFLGVVLLNDIREIMFKRELYENTYVHDLMNDAPEQIGISDNMEVVMKKFETSDAWNLPVLDNGRYVGFVSKSKLFSAYRSLLKDFYQDQ